MPPAAAGGAEGEQAGAEQCRGHRLGHRDARLAREGGDAEARGQDVADEDRPQAEIHHAVAGGVVAESAQRPRPCVETDRERVAAGRIDVFRRPQREAGEARHRGIERRLEPQRLRAGLRDGHRAEGEAEVQQVGHVEGPVRGNRRGVDRQRALDRSVVDRADRAAAAADRAVLALARIEEDVGRGGRREPGQYRAGHRGEQYNYRFHRNLEVPVLDPTPPRIGSGVPRRVDRSHRAMLGAGRQRLGK